MTQCMTNNQKKIVEYLKETLDLDDKELVLDYDSNSVVLVDTIVDFTLLFHFIYIDNTIVLISDKNKKI